MTVANYIELSKSEAIVLGDSKQEITGVYAGDFLSHVMAGGKDGDIWFTVMNNVNVAAVAKLAGFSAVVICESIKPDEILIKKCTEQNINLIITKLPIYEACVGYSQL